MSGPYRLIELFVYAALVLVGVVLLVQGKGDKQMPPEPEPAGQVERMEGEEVHAVLFDQQG